MVMEEHSAIFLPGIDHVSVPTTIIRENPEPFGSRILPLHSLHVRRDIGSDKMAPLIVRFVSCAISVKLPRSNST